MSTWPDVSTRSASGNNGAGTVAEAGAAARAGAAAGTREGLGDAEPDGVIADGLEEEGAEGPGFGRVWVIVMVCMCG